MPWTSRSVGRGARPDDAEAVVRVHELASAAQFEELIGRSLDDALPLAEPSSLSSPA